MKAAKPPARVYSTVGRGPKEENWLELIEGAGEFLREIDQDENLGYLCLALHYKTDPFPGALYLDKQTTLELIQKLQEYVEVH